MLDSHQQKECRGFGEIENGQLQYMKPSTVFLRQNINASAPFWHCASWSGNMNQVPLIAGSAHVEPTHRHRSAPSRRPDATSWKDVNGNWVHRSSVDPYRDDVLEKKRSLPSVLSTRMGSLPPRPGSANKSKQISSNLVPNHGSRRRKLECEREVKNRLHTLDEIFSRKPTPSEIASLAEEKVLPPRIIELAQPRRMKQDLKDLDFDDADLRRRFPRRGPNQDRLEELASGGAHLERMSPRTLERYYKVKEMSLEKSAGRVVSNPHNTQNAAKAALARRWGSLLAAWRLGLDVDGNGRITFFEWGRAMREAGFQGSAKVTFQLFCKDGCEFIKLDDIDPESAQKLHEQEEAARKEIERQEHKLQKLNEKSTGVDMIDKMDRSFKTLKRKWVELHGDLWTVWKNMLDQGDGRTTRERFCAAARTVGFPGDLRVVFNEVDVSQNGVISAAEFDEGVGIRFLEEKKKREENHKQMVEEKKKQLKEQEVLMTIEELKLLLCRKYGSLEKGWRNCLDPGNNGRVSLGEFCTAVRKVGFKGHLKEAFIELDQNGNGFITINELDAEAANAFRLHEAERRKSLEERERKEEESAAMKEQNSVKKRMVTLGQLERAWAKKYGSLAKAWQETLDVHGRGKITIAEFTKAAKQIGFDGNIKETFKALDANGGGTVSLEEMGDKVAEEVERLAEEQSRAAEKSDAPDSGNQSKDMAITSPSALPRLLVRRFGSLEKAWKEVLDTDNDGKCFIGCFAEGCRQAGFAGGYRAAFRSFDAQGRGYVTLADIDTGAADEFEKHEQARKRQEAKDDEKYAEKMEAIKIEKAAKKGPSNIAELQSAWIKMYGNITDAWFKVLDPDGDMKVTLATFSEALRGVGYAGEIKALFSELAGTRGFFTPEDFDEQSAELIRKRSQDSEDPAERRKKKIAADGEQHLKDLHNEGSLNDTEGPEKELKKEMTAESEQQRKDLQSEGSYEDGDFEGSDQGDEDKGTNTGSRTSSHQRKDSYQSEFEDSDAGNENDMRPASSTGGYSDEFEGDTPTATPSQQKRSKGPNAASIAEGDESDPASPKPQPTDQPTEAEVMPEGPEAEAAALRIQKVQRGKKARRRAEEVKKKKKQKNEAEAAPNDDPEMEEAAKRIQSIHRGRKARKRAAEVRKQKEKQSGKTVEIIHGSMNDNEDADFSPSDSKEDGDYDDDFQDDEDDAGDVSKEAADDYGEDFEGSSSDHEE
eukprot:gnl/MRDRNA2_/MRDRNA2_92278_c0_seq1.p1 gnl/MRDRNA2_/MRDRNA2_92278_c0~~gnl/MRDRNA2_/MRDRNA2_92278_c0_seq1.p1  ORF type:complete len:1217 (-),score=374.01 gnl/MRDRNA2_/MRDRNA2_92278_c0_seq1:38-3688(-)